MKKMKKIISRILVVIMVCLSAFSVANAAESASTEVQITIEAQKENSPAQGDSDEDKDVGKSDEVLDDEDKTKVPTEDEGTDNKVDTDANPKTDADEGIKPVQTGDRGKAFLYFVGFGAALSAIVVFTWKTKKKNQAFLMALGVLASALLFQPHDFSVNAADAPFLGNAISQANVASQVDTVSQTETSSQVDVTVPAAIAITFNEEGTNSVGAFGIENHTSIPLTVKQVQVTECNDWKLVDKGQNIPANTKQLTFALEEQCLKAGENAANIKVNAFTNRQLNVGVERGAWSTSKTAEAAFQMQFEYVWNEEETEAYAIYCADDESLNFYRSVEPIQKGSVHRGKTVTEVYTGFEDATYTWGTTPWHSLRTTIQRVEFHDTIRPVNMAHWFLEFYYANYGDMTKLDTSRVTSMEYMCHKFGVYAESLEMKGLADWDVSKVTNMFFAFCYAGYNAKGDVYIGDLSRWNVSNVTDMCRAFGDIGSKTTNLTFCGMEKWNTANVTEMSCMFQNTGKSDPDWSLNLSGWNVQKVTAHSYFDENVEAKIIDPIWVR